MSVDILDDTIGRGGVPRDRFQRALLVPPEGGERRPYTSMSTLATQLNAYLKPLHEWELCAVAQGVGMSRELSALAGSSRWSTWAGEEDEGRNREERQILEDVVYRAKERAGAHRKADYGSAFHRYVEVEDPLGEPPEEMAVDIAAFRRKLRMLGIQIIDTEVFVVNERVGAAGMFDYLLSVPWRPLLVIGDSKTGRLKLDCDEIQIAGYADSVIYDRDTNERMTFAEKYGMDVDQEYGLTIRTAAESGESDLHPVDLAAGREGLELAARVHKRNADARKRYNKKARQPLDIAALAQDRAARRIAAVQGAGFHEISARLKEIHADYKEVWTEDLTDLGRQILREAKTRENAA